MKRPMMTVASFFVVLVLSFPLTGECARSKSLYDWLLAKEKPVRTYVADVTDSSGKSGECLPLLKKNMEGMLATRKKIQFAVVDDKEQADMILECDITEFFWTDTDPIDDISGLGPIAIDAARKENYGRLTCFFTITEARTGKVLWKSRLKATITGSQITPENAAEMLSERMMDVLTKGAMTKRVETNLVTGPRAR